MNIRLWKPVASLPWRAIRKGTDGVVWFDVVSCQGDEIFSTGSVRREEEESVLAEVCHVLTLVNNSKRIQVGHEWITVEWNGEKSKDPALSIAYNQMTDGANGSV